MCMTLLGYTVDFPTQFDIFFQKPLHTWESSRILSFSLKFLRRDSDQFHIGTFTSSWYMLNFLCLLNW